MKATKCPKCGQIIPLEKLVSQDDWLGETLATIEDDEPRMWQCPASRPMTSRIREDGLEIWSGGPCCFEQSPAHWTANMFHIPGDEPQVVSVATVQQELFL